MKHYIYGLIDPVSSEVRYVGQCLNMKKRLQVHTAPSILVRKSPLANWLRNLLPLKPWMVSLETVECDASRHDSNCAGTVSETKWLKRFRRTILNKAQRDNSPSTWDSLVNPKA
jgi:hypothetical protein